MKTTKIIYLLFLLIGEVHSQNYPPTTWYFGDHAVLSFDKNGNTSMTGDNDMVAWEGCTVLNSPDGKVIFYANGQECWWENGDSVVDPSKQLLGNSSATHASITVPIPRETNDTASGYKFLIFSLKEIGSSSNYDLSVTFVKVTPQCINNSQRYNVDIDTSVYLTGLDPLSEKLAMTLDGGSGFWVIAHNYLPYSSSTTFYKYHITLDPYYRVNSTLEVADYLNNNVITQSIGSNHSEENGSLQSAIGQMKFSQSGTTLGLVIANKGVIDVFDFVKASGVLQNFRTASLSTLNGLLYGCEFSPDSNYLYTSESKAINNPKERHIYQWKILSNSILTTPYVVSSDNTTPDSIYAYNALQLGPNRKIYCSHRKYNESVSVINNPNIFGVGCNYQEDFVNISDGGHYSLPNYLKLTVSNLRANAGNDLTICQGDSVRIGGNPIAYGGLPCYNCIWGIKDKEGQPVILSDSAHPYVQPSSSQMVYLRVTDSSDPQQISFDSVFITVRDSCPVLIANAGKDHSPCIGDTVRLGSNPTASGGIPFENGNKYHYFWTSIPPGFTSTLANPIVATQDSMTFIVIVSDSVNQIAMDTTLVNPKKCSISWPRYIYHSSFECNRLSCNAFGDLLCTFTLSSSDTVANFGDTTFRLPISYRNSLVFFNKDGHLQWYNNVNAIWDCMIMGILTDDQRNSFIRFYARNGYSFFDGPSLNLSQTDWRQYLAKIDRFGTVDWVQSFSPFYNYPYSSYYGSPVQSLCTYHDTLYLAGYCGNDTIFTGKTETGLTPWNLGSDHNFIATVNTTTGDVMNVRSFNTGQNNPDSMTYITILHDSILVVHNGRFYLFNLSSEMISAPQQVYNETRFYQGWLNLGGKIISKSVGCVSDSNGVFIKKWTNSTAETEWHTQYLHAGGFSTNEHIYFLEPHSFLSNYFVKMNIDDGSIETRRFDSIGGLFSIMGNINFNYGYCARQMSSGVKIDTFSIPNGIPKNEIIDPGNESSNSDCNPDRISIFPNPSESRYLTISCKMAFDPIYSIEIMNFAGLLVKKITGSTSTYLVDIRDLPRGVYMVHVKTSDCTFKKKIVKL